MDAPFTVRVRRFSIFVGQHVQVFQVILEGELKGEESVWHEMLKSEETLRAFICGVRAGAYMSSGAFVMEPKIPDNAIVLEALLPEEGEEEKEEERLAS